MPSFRLKVRTTEIDLPVGELTVGRGSDCFLRIDDDLVSRRHARLLVTEDRVTFEDLGSRNGSRINGVKAVGKNPLKLGDSFEVGAQAFQLLVGGKRGGAGQKTMLPMRSCRNCNMPIELGLEVCGNCGAPQSDAVAEVGQGEPIEAKQTKGFAASFAVVVGLADKLFAMGRTDEAERMVGPRLRDLVERARGGEAQDPGVVTEAIKRGVRLSALTGRGEWYSWIFEYCRHAGARLDGKTLDELHANMLVHKPAASDALMYYYASQTSEDEGSVLYRKRLEALLRFCR